MLKIIVSVSDAKDNKCTVKLITPKDLSKASETEKNTGAIVINQITKALKEIQD